MDVSRELTDTEAKILLSLAKEKEKSYSTLLKERLAGSNKTILRSLKKLGPKKLNLVKLRKGENEKGFVGRKSTYYRINLFGLLRLFYHFRKDENKLLKIFQKKIVKPLGLESVPLIADIFKKEIPLVFGEWNYFKKEGVEEIAKKHLVDTLKYCGKEYKRFLEGLKEISKQERFYEQRKKLQEKWKQEKNWAQLITQTFLYDSFQHLEHDVPPQLLDINRLFISSLKGDDERKLQQIIQKNEQLRLYCLTYARKESYLYALHKPKRRDSTFTHKWDPFLTESEIYSTLLTKEMKEAGHPDPLYKIADTAFKGDCFSVAVEACQLYKNYTFTSVRECADAIFGLTQNLAKERNPFLWFALTLEENDLEKETQKMLLEKFKELTQKVGVKLEPSDVIEEWKLEIFMIVSAMYFFALKEIRVWDGTFYQLELNPKRIEKFEESRKQAEAFLDIRKKAMKFINQQIAEGSQKKGYTTDCNQQLLFYALLILKYHELYKIP